jgi:hypothetical protein
MALLEDVLAKFIDELCLRMLKSSSDHFGAFLGSVGRSGLEHAVPVVVNVDGLPELWPIAPWRRPIWQHDPPRSFGAFSVPG